VTAEQSICNAAKEAAWMVRLVFQQRYVESQRRELCRWSPYGVAICVAFDGCD
jgi:hypothetical protein